MRNVHVFWINYHRIALQKRRRKALLYRLLDNNFSLILGTYCHVRGRITNCDCNLFQPKSGVAGA